VHTPSPWLFHTSLSIASHPKNEWDQRTVCISPLNREHSTSSHTYQTHNTILPFGRFALGITSHQPPPRPSAHQPSRHLSMCAPIQQASHLSVRLYGAEAIRIAGGVPETPKVAFAEARGSGGHTSCTQILLIHPSRHYRVDHAEETGQREDVRVSAHSAS
jgi:hypothetical protein